MCERRPGPGRTGADAGLPAGRRRRPSGAPPPLPRHIERSGLIWLGVALLAIGGAIAVFAGGLSRWAVDVMVVDDAVTRWVAGAPVPGFTAAARVIAEAGAAPTAVIVGYLLLLALIVFRRFRHLLVLVVSYEVLTLLTTVFLLVVHRPLPFGVLVQFRWAGFSMPSVEIEKVCAVLTGALYTLVPAGRWRRRGSWAAAVIVAVIGLSRMRLGVDAPTDVLLGAVLGVTVPLLGLRLFAPEESFPVVYGGAHGAHLDLGGARGEAITGALKDQMDIEVSGVEPFGLAGSGGSSPMRLRQAGQPGGYLFGKLYARSHVRADRWYKLGRQLLYGRLEDEQSFKGVRRLVQQEDYALRLCRAAGLPSPEPYGFVELTPDREYLLLTEFFAGSAELGDAEVDDAVIDDGLLIVRRMWDAGLAHRDIKPANLLVRDDHLLLIDVAFAEVRPTPWRQAVDLANMMLCLALRSSAERVYQRALQYFTVTEISEAFAAAPRDRAAVSAAARDPRQRPRPARGVPPAPATPARAGPGSALEHAPGSLLSRRPRGGIPAGHHPGERPDQHRHPSERAAGQQHGLPRPAATAGRGPVGAHSQRGCVRPAAAPWLDPEPGPGAARHVGHHAGQRPGRQRRAAADPDPALRGQAVRRGPATRAGNQAIPHPGRRCPVRSHLV
jgi:tRNA A-37 threonylcarbamoyl transferase component Bud32/membrane-associated phospholipid phosphatase